MIIVGVILVPTVIAALLILLKLADTIEEDNRIIELGMESARMYNEALDARMRKIRRLRHDTLGLLQAIENAGDNDKWDDSNSNNSNMRQMTLPDAIVSLKKKQCKEAGIRFDIRANNSALRSLRDMPKETDLCLLIQNLLENAYEANLRIKDKDRRQMSLTIEPAELSAHNDMARRSETDDRIFIRASNSLPENERPSFITRKVNPELHGIGMKVIDEIIAKYDGTKEVETDSDKGELSICIYLNKRSV